MKIIPRNFRHARAALSLAAALIYPAAVLAQTSQLPEPPVEIRLPAPAINGDDWRPGLDYFAVFTPWKFIAKPGKVVVIVRHQYSVHECRWFEPYLAEWLKTKPDYIEVVRKPHIHYPHARAQARIFLTLQQLGREDLHLPFYEWLWDKARYKIYHQLRRPDFPAIDRLNVEFVKANGIDEQQFREIYFSPKMDVRVIDEEADTLWEGDSSFCINGRYTTDFGRTAWNDLNQAMTKENIARFFRLVEYLTADELKHTANLQPANK